MVSHMGHIGLECGEEAQRSFGYMGDVKVMGYVKDVGNPHFTSTQGGSGRPIT